MARERILSTAQIETRISEILSSGKLMRSSGASICDNFNKFVYELHSRTSTGQRRYSPTTVGYARGYFSALYSQIQRDHLEFVYRGPDGTLYSTHKETTFQRVGDLIDSGRASMLNDLPNTHVWRGTSMPFSPWVTFAAPVKETN